ncbi:MAG: hydroxyacylglutathione hydrolase [Paracoccaceae bacterium]
MPLVIETIPCLSDNYAFLAHDSETGATALVDAPEAAPVLEVLDQKGWSLSHVLLTHHHWDHVDGLEGILTKHKATVIGAASDQTRLPPLDIALSEGDSFDVGSESGVVIDVSGHTIGHIAFHFPKSRVVFTADSLMALGCGRVFEGTKPQMWNSLKKLAALPPDTVVCSGHEYTEANAKFALSVDAGNEDLQNRVKTIAKQRAAGQATVPSLLSEELATNPFLRAADPILQANLGMAGAGPTDVFTEIRSRKDNF